MSKHHCPFQKVCPFRNACEGHKWLCFWVIWLALILGVGFVGVIFWLGGPI